MAKVNKEYQARMEGMSVQLVVSGSIAFGWSVTPSIPPVSITPFFRMYQMSAIYLVLITVEAIFCVVMLNEGNTFI